MKTPVIAAILLVLAVPAFAAKQTVTPAYKIKCTGECPFFDAWALTKLCPGLSLNGIGRTGAAFFVRSSGGREILRKEIKGIKKYGYDEQPGPANYCNPKCKSYEGVELEASACHFLHW